MRKLLHHPSAVVGALLVVAFLAAALAAPWLAPAGPDAGQLAHALQPPSSGHPLGTDELGRDLAVRLVYGARLSLLIGLAAVFVGAAVGVPVGLVAGYRQGTVDLAVMRLIDILNAFPPILLALGLIAVFGQGLVNTAVAVGVAGVPIYTRLVRGVALSTAQEDFVLAARALGASGARIMVRHLLPACIPPLLVIATLQMAGAILTASGLSFIGLGAPSHVAEWGAMLARGRSYVFSAPHLVIFPGIALMLVVLGFNLLGDGLRDVLDPRLRRGG